MKKSKEMCVGCYNNEYNHGLGGAKECWSYESAKAVKRLVIGSMQPPPYNKKDLTSVLSCRNKPMTCYVDPDALDSQGYWKRL